MREFEVGKGWKVTGMRVEWGTMQYCSFFTYVINLQIRFRAILKGTSGDGQSLSSNHAISLDFPCEMVDLFDFMIYEREEEARKPPTSQSFALEL